MASPRTDAVHGAAPSFSPAAPSPAELPSTWSPAPDARSVEKPAYPAIPLQPVAPPRTPSSGVHDGAVHPAAAVAAASDRDGDRRIDAYSQPSARRGVMNDVLMDAADAADRRRGAAGSGGGSRRRSFLAMAPQTVWTTAYVLDYAVLVVLLVAWVLLSRLPPAVDRPFDLNDASIGHAHAKGTVSRTLLYTLVILVPLGIFAAYVVVDSAVARYARGGGGGRRRRRRRRSSAHDAIDGGPGGAMAGPLPAARPAVAGLPSYLLQFNSVLLGAALALIGSQCVTAVLKHWASRLRPDFLARCAWDAARQQCTGDPATVRDGRRSWPSGHASASFATMVFIAAWVAGKTGVWWSLASERARAADRRAGTAFARDGQAAVHGRVWTLVLAVLPLLLCSWIAITRTTDYRHFPSDVASGAVIGAVSAGVAYRLYFRPASGEPRGVALPSEPVYTTVPQHYHGDV
ncbi:hypothetical protein CXG81DRAFT_18661 [Caulochytrium protostelioides]|uniref:Phosphatidic acid phosphatase type 2/haloperoxidase domain-containing protein n=1 Tax=Caulochytrium protostelioides TaxID=1555241 RepID=A0A4P9X8D7_9FUNG|nr:hypothetical protein CXG81DRAFT_18661 [Caulochytrium protostelioides]|eukprot:RKP01554.1 hypothetical protein CXG81DRAFT_18661 [Caulochytrium protostelioides]